MQESGKQVFTVCLSSAPIDEPEGWVQRVNTTLDEKAIVLASRDKKFLDTSAQVASLPRDALA